MIKRYSTNPQVNPEGWLGKNWQNTGYDIYAFFPTFSSANDRVGVGDFRVDFAAVFNDFMKYTEALKPIAILSFGRETWGANWIVEVNYPPRFLNMFRSGVIPTEVGEGLQYAIPSALKLKTTYHSSLPVKEIMKRVPNSIINKGGDPGSIQCEFVAYLGGWYHSEHDDPRDPAYNVMQGFIHVTSRDDDYVVRATNETLAVVVEGLQRAEQSVRHH